MRLAKVLLLTLAFVLPLRAQELTIEQRLQKLEAEVRALKAENEKLRLEVSGLASPAAQPSPTPTASAAKAPPPAPAADQPATVKSAGTPATLVIGGLIQAQGESGDAIDSRILNDYDRFYLRRARLSANGKFLQNFDYRLEFDLAGSLSNSSAMRAQMTDGYVTWTRFPEASVRAGQFKTPFGYEQLVSDPRLLAPERSLVNDRLTAGRQLGAMLAGDLAEKRLRYAVGVFNGSGTNQNFNDNDELMVAGRVAGDLYKANLAGGTALWSAGANAISSTDSAVVFGPDFGFDLNPTGGLDNVFAGNREGFGLDTQLAIDRFDFASEYLRMTFEPDNAIPTERFRSDGWYAQASWYLLPKLQILTRFETFNPNDQLIDVTTDTWTTGLNYYFKGHDLKLQLYYLLSDPPGPEDSFGRVLARIQAAF